MTRTLIIIALLGLGLPLAAAETSHISADKMVFQEKQGVTVFTGHVVYTQPAEAITIHADKLTVVTRDKELVSVEAKGTPVRFSHEGGDKPIKGEAEKLDYDGGRELVILTGNAYVQSGEDRIQGAVIEYDMKTKQAQASGGEEEGRFEATITPKDQQ